MPVLKTNKLLRTTKLTEYKVEWTQCPTAYNPPKVLFIEAQNEEDASVLAKDHIERNFGIGRSVIDKITETKEMPEGGVVGSKYGDHHVRG